MRIAIPRVLVTATATALAAAAFWLLWQAYVASPWTRDGRVRANVVQIAPDVSGVIVEVRVRDNQAVRKGDVLMVIDPERYRLAVAEAEATLAGRATELEQRRREFQRRNELTSSAISNESREQAAAAFHAAEAAHEQARARLEQARLDLAHCGTGKDQDRPHAGKGHDDHLHPIAEAQGDQRERQHRDGRDRTDGLNGDLQETIHRRQKA